MRSICASLLLALGLAAPALADRLPIFDDHADYVVRSFDEGRIWVDQGKVTYLCSLAPAQAPEAMVLRNCHPLITPTRHHTFSVAHAATAKVQAVVAAAPDPHADPARNHIEEEVSDLEALVRAVSLLDDRALAEKMLTYSKDLAALSGHSCVLEPAEMAPANAINAGQLLFLEFGIVTAATDAVTLPMGMELEVRSYLDQLRYLVVQTPELEIKVARLDELNLAVREVRQRLRAANDKLRADGRHIYDGRLVRIKGCA